MISLFSPTSQAGWMEWLRHITAPSVDPALAEAMRVHGGRRQVYTGHCERTAARAMARTARRERLVRRVHDRAHWRKSSAP